MQIDVKQDIFNIKNLSLSEKLLLSHIKSFTPPFIESDKYLSSTTGLTIGRIKNILTSLEKKNFIFRARIKNKRQIFTCVIEDGLPVDNLWITCGYVVDNLCETTPAGHALVTRSQLILYIIYYNNNYSNNYYCYKTNKKLSIRDKKIYEVIDLFAKKNNLTLTKEKADEIFYYVSFKFKITEDEKDIYTFAAIAIKLIKNGAWKTPKGFENEKVR